MPIRTAVSGRRSRVVAALLSFALIAGGSILVAPAAGADELPVAPPDAAVSAVIDGDGTETPVTPENAAAESPTDPSTPAETIEIESESESESQPQQSDLEAGADDAAALQSDLKIAADELAVIAPATLSVSKTSGLDPAGETVTVSGAGFDAQAAAAHGAPGMDAGVYVQVGWIKDVWAPSAGAANNVDRKGVVTR